MVRIPAKAARHTRAGALRLSATSWSKNPAGTGAASVLDWNSWTNCSLPARPAAVVGCRARPAGDATAARDVLVEAADLARQLGDTDGFARAAIGIHQLGALSGLSRDHTVRLLEEAVSNLADQSSPLRARALASLARELHHTWDPRRRTTGPAPSPPRPWRSPASSTTRPPSPSASSPSTTPVGPSDRPANVSPSWPRCSTSPASPATANCSPRPSC